MNAPVIKQYVLPAYIRITALGLTAIALFATGYVGGIASTMVDMSGHPSVQIILQLPQQTPFVNDEPVIKSADLLERRWNYNSLAAETKCLADNIYFEGRDQKIDGQVAIGLATLNRVESKYYPDSICDVVWQQNKDSRTGKMTAQFSWTLDGKSDKIGNKKAYKEIKRLAEAMLAEGTLDNFHDFTDGATHYHADYVNPYWSDSLTLVAQIDDHIFYKQ